MSPMLWGDFLADNPWFERHMRRHAAQWFFTGIGVGIMLGCAIGVWLS